MIWFAVLGGIAAWLVHLIATASLVAAACPHHPVLWVVHTVTAITLLVTAAAMTMSWRLRFAADEPRRFLGDLGMLLNATNLALILLEGSFVLFIHPCA